MTLSRKGLAIAAAFFVGLVAGGSAVAVMSARASRLHVQMTRLRLASELADRTGLAWKRGDLPSAAIHASCAVDVEGDTAAFNPLDTFWDFSFPVMGLWTTEKTKYPVEDRGPLVALAHARLGVVLERMGRTDDALREFAAAAAVSKARDPGQWRMAGTSTLDK